MSQVIRKEFKSVTGQMLDARLWLPEGQPRGVVQLVHGMAEHIDRYDATARALNSAGYAVTGHTHLGHGSKAEILGYFGEPAGWRNLLTDIHQLREETREQFPDLPYAVLGHSMGSFLTRCYLMEHGEGLSAAVISGTGYYPPVMVKAGLALAALEKLRGNGKKPSQLIDKLAFGSMNKAFRPARTPSDWLTRDEAIVDAYVADPYCGFVFTASGYGDMFSGLDRLNQLQDLKRMDKDLPVLFIAGASDPVGARGKGVNTVADQFTQAGVEDVTVRLYPDARHEILNETNRKEVWADLIAWLNEKM